MEKEQERPVHTRDASSSVEQVEPVKPPSAAQKYEISKKWIILSFNILLLSISINAIIWGISRIKSAQTSPFQENKRCPSPYAGLAYDTPSSIEYTTKYTQENQTLADQEWEAIATGHGSIALDQESIKAWNLPPAQEFVWDESKSVYVLNAYHSLHCLKLLHTSIEDSHNQVLQRAEYGQLVRCLDFLRQDVICNADDTPLYTIRGSKAPPGIGQKRQCRDFNKLEQWAIERSACYTSETSKDPGFHDQ